MAAVLQTAVATRDALSTGGAAAGGTVGVAAHAAATPTAGGSSLNRRLAALVSLIFIPGLAFGLYRSLGAVEYPDQPLEARLKAAGADFVIEDISQLMPVVQEIARRIDRIYRRRLRQFAVG